MGNNHSNQSSSSNLNGLSRARSIVRRSKNTKKFSKRPSKSSLSCHEAFFIAHHKAQQAAGDGITSPISPITSTTTDQSVDLRKRVLFVSLMGLYQSWKNVPSTILFSSIFLLPLRREWIYSNEKYQYQHDFQHVLNDTNFIKLLKWKDAQGLAFWMRDGIPSNELQKCTTPCTPDFIGDDCEYNVDVAPFWRYLSYKLSLLYDPMTGNNYNPLKLDYKWWQNRFIESNGFDKESTLHFNASTDGIRKELYFLTMKFKTMRELLYQSNKTLNIVTIYTLNVDDNGDSMNNSITNNGSIRSRTKETSQKSYTSLPDHVLCEMAEDYNNYQIDVDTSCSIDQLNLNGEITPNPNESNTGNEDEDHNDDNIWWVSTEYDEVMEIHDNDQLYQDDEFNDNPLLTPRENERDNEKGNDSVLIITARATI